MAKKSPHRSSEELKILGVLAIPARAILARNADRPIKLLADGEAAAPVRLLESSRINLIFAALACRQLAHARRQQRLQFFEALAGDGVDSPSLQIAAGRRTGGPFNKLAYDCLRHRFGQEGAARVPAGHSIAHVHRK